MEISQVGSIHFEKAWLAALLTSHSCPSYSTPSTHAHTAERTPSDVLPSASGTARDVERQLPVVHGLSLPQLLPLSEGAFLLTFCM